MPTRCYAWMDMNTMPIDTDVEVRDALAYRAVARRRPNGPGLTLVEGHLAGRPIGWRWREDDPRPVPSSAWPVGVPSR